MIQAEILKPLAVLAMWTMVMWVWMYATRIPAINKLPKPTTSGADQGWTGAMRLGGFSTQRLMEFLMALGRDVEIVVRQEPRSRKRGRLRIAAASRR